MRLSMKLPLRLMVSQYIFHQEANELNSEWNLKQTPGDVEGVQLGFAESLQEHIILLF